MQDLHHQIATLNDELESLSMNYNRLRKLTTQIQSSLELLEKTRSDQHLEQEENLDCHSISTGFTGISEFSLKPCANLLGASFRIQTPVPYIAQYKQNTRTTDDFNYSDLYVIENSSSRLRFDSYDKCSDRKTDRLVEETLFRKPNVFKQRLAQTKRRIKKILKGKKTQKG
jgi:hypothetical protein